MTLKKKPFGNIGGKEEKAGFLYFLLFLQCYSFTPLQTDFKVSFIFIVLSTNAFNLDKCKILLSDKELSVTEMIECL